MKYAEHQKKKRISKQRKQIYIIITIITLLLLISTAVLASKIAQNGLSLKGMLMTSIGQNETDIQNLEPFYCLVLGVSEDIEVELTDTIMLCAYYPNEQKVSILSIPRDTFVGDSTKNVSSYDKINALYQTSPEKTLQAVRNLTGIDVQNYVVISNNALRDVVNEIGGVYFNVPMDMEYDDTSQDLHIDLKEGYQLLDGDKAEQLVRFRHNNDGSTYPSDYGMEDIGRMRTQREFLKAAAEQILSGSNIFKIDDIMEAVFENVETNLTLDELIKYVPSATEFNTENIQSEVLPGVPDYIGILSFYVSDEEETNEVVTSLFGLTEEQIEANREKSGKKVTNKTSTNTTSSSNKNNTTKNNTNTSNSKTNTNNNTNTNTNSSKNKINTNIPTTGTSSNNEKTPTENNSNLKDDEDATTKPSTNTEPEKPTTSVPEKEPDTTTKPETGNTNTVE